MVSLVIIWLICFLGIIALFKVIKREEYKPFFNNSIGKKVIDKNGLYLGNLQNFSIDEKTGMVSRLFVEPSKHIDSQHYTFDETGNIILPFDSIELNENDIIIQK